MKEAESALKTRDGCSIGAKESVFQAPPAPMFGKGCNYFVLELFYFKHRVHASEPNVDWREQNISSCSKQGPVEQQQSGGEGDAYPDSALRR